MISTDQIASDVTAAMRNLDNTLDELRTQRSAINKQIKDAVLEKQRLSRIVRAVTPRVKTVSHGDPE